MPTVLTEKEFKNMFVAAATHYILAINGQDKCLTDNFVELARTAAFKVSLPWTMPSYELARLFEHFLDEFRQAAEAYNLRLQQSQADEQARWQLAAEEANKLLLNGLTHNLLVRALEQYQRSTPAEQAELLAALQIDFNRANAAES